MSYERTDGTKQTKAGRRSPAFVVHTLEGMMAAPEMVRVKFTQGEWAIVDRLVVGNGGHQRTLRKILQRTNRQTLVVDIPPVEWERVNRYADDYGSGGYQDRFRAIQKAERRTRAGAV